MAYPREITRIEPAQGLVLFGDGETGAIVQWMDGAGWFHEHPVDGALALIVKDPVDGYHTIDLRHIRRSGCC